MIHNIVFDMGRVLIYWQQEQLMAPLHLTKEEEDLLFRELFLSVEWVQLDRGTIEDAAAVRQVCSRLPENLHSSVEKIITGWWELQLLPIPGMAELIHELKAAGYGIYLLSNASKNLRKYFSRIPGSESFDGIMVSAEENLLKPQHEIYERLYGRFRLNPAECFFIDDSPANIEGALCTGMDGAVFHGSAAELRRILEQKHIL